MIEEKETMTTVEDIERQQRIRRRLFRLFMMILLVLLCTFIGWVISTIGYKPIHGGASLRDLPHPPVAHARVLPSGTGVL
jgi:hypothetical protein